MGLHEKGRHVRVLLLGVGLQGKAALHDLAMNPKVTHIVAADRDRAALDAYVSAQGFGGKVQTQTVDGRDRAGLDRLMADGPDVAIDLMPPVFIGQVAEAAVANGVHLVNTFYVVPELAAPAERARDAGLTILPEFGMDPGIDLVLLGQAVRTLDTVDEVITYGAGFPEADAAMDNPLGYKVTWTFEGVLKSYHRAARVIRDGSAVEIDANEMFAPRHVHTVRIDGLGELEAFANGDALHYADALDLDPSSLKNLGRYVLRWPGHCAFWDTVNRLRLLDDEPVDVDGVPVDRKRFLANAIAPRLQFRPGQRDVVVVRIEVGGTRQGAPTRLVYELIDRRDLETGFMAMSRTVGFTAAIGAAMIADGSISKRGLASPICDVPFQAFRDALDRRGIRVNVSAG